MIAVSSWNSSTIWKLECEIDIFLMATSVPVKDVSAAVAIKIITNL